jgi:hypothetical protein
MTGGNPQILAILEVESIPIGLVVEFDRAEQLVRVYLAAQRRASIALTRDQALELSLSLADAAMNLRQGGQP